MLSSYVRFLYRARWFLAPFFVTLFIFSMMVAKHLQLRSDFKELLPENFQSVKDLNRIIDRVGGTGSLIVAIESNNPGASIHFGEDLVARLKAYPPDYINRIEYNVSDLKEFFEKNKYLYMDLNDLREIRDRLSRRIQKEKLKKIGLLLDLETKEEEKAGFDTQDIENKYRSKIGPYENYTKGYFFGEGGRLMAILIRPPGDATGIDFSRRLVTKINQTISELNPVSYDPSMKVGLTGKFRRVLFEYQTLINDIVSTAVLCVLLVGLVVLIYYRKIRMVLLMAWITLNGTVWAFAITAWKIGYLTTQTGFLGSIIVGNGINYGIILMARYLEERRQGRAPLESLEISVPATAVGTLASSVTSSVAFGTLMMTQIRGFSHFGFIGGLGMFACWVATYTMLPVFLSITEEIWPLYGKAPLFKKVLFSFSPMSFLATHLDSWSLRLSRVLFVILGLSIPLIVYFVPRSLEYDFTKLRVKTKGQQVSEEAVLNDRVKKIFLGSLTPAILVTDRQDQAVPLCDEIKRKNELDPPDKRVVDSCKSLYSYVPKDQDQKLGILREIRHLLEDKSLNFLNGKQKVEVEKFKHQFVGKKISVQDLPENLVKNYREKNGHVGKIVYVSPTDKAPLWNGKNLIRFADIIRFNRLPNGEVITGSGDSVIFADLLRSVMHDGPRAIVMAFLAVCLVVIFIFWDLKGSAFIIGTFFLGVLWMGGMIALLNIKINFFNFIAIPTTFGIGIDYGCNIYQRYQQEKKGSLPKVLRTTGGAVALCSLTTMIGYFTLIIAKNQALVSFGWIAIIGEMTCIMTALIFVPAVVTQLEKKGVKIVDE